ncbi:acylneuraminate cytidylyltransferase family protein [Prosthecobacter sp.]|uniref:acylneuraminate cytidylyltransferase family protein n=1 Tax=Prosthecobacter sp. TaxID=1965333 RepID=UPI001D7C168F|nr:acylneuraminate cytidylyltransferase family protein [Prosthecobacter sp.]MCB1275283.1 acylneuraminate cytidylyltransferase family protein [Prosthecobacter sp.]
MAKPRIFGLIPARGGSKGIPGKNLRSLGGKPLLQWAFEAAKNSGVVERVLLSTDSEEIAALGRQLGIEVPFLRPPEFAQDDTPMIAVLKHLIEHLRASGDVPDAIMLLQPTAPLRRAEHLKKAGELLVPEDVDSVVGVTEIPQHYAPHYAMKITPEGQLTHYLPDSAAIKRRQDVPKAYSRDGTVYLFRLSTLEKYNDIYGANCIPLLIPSDETLNLDTMEDWEHAERVFAKTTPA